MAAGHYPANLTVPDAFDSDSMTRAPKHPNETSSHSRVPRSRLPVLTRGVCEEINRNDRFDLDGVLAFCQNMDSIKTEFGIAPYDFKHNGRIDFDDAIMVLYDEAPG